MKYKTIRRKKKVTSSGYKNITLSYSTTKISPFCSRQSTVPVVTRTPPMFSWIKYFVASNLYTNGLFSMLNDFPTRSLGKLQRPIIINMWQLFQQFCCYACRSQSILYAVKYIMQNTQPYIKQQNDDICLFNILVQDSIPIYFYFVVMEPIII